MVKMKTIKPVVTHSTIRNSEGVWFDCLWDETNNTIHLVESSNNSTRMYDFEQTRGVQA